MILRIISGPLKGRVFPVEDNITLGRSKGDLLLKDPKVSNPHAQIHRSNNQFILKNLSSTRGITYQEKTVSLVILQPGIVFQLGSTALQVDKKSFQLEENLSLAPDSSNASSGDDLKSVLKNQLASSQALLKDESRSLDFLKNSVQMEFEKGVQKGVRWDIMYLPRTVGLIDADLPLLDPHAPKISFEVFLEKEKIMFCTCHEETVLLNYQRVRKKQLKHKDLIIVGASYIRVFMNQESV